MAITPWGIALGGGGSRTFAHLGVLLELEAAGLAPSFVAGGSLGALLGALYAAQPPEAPNPAARAASHAIEYFESKKNLGGRRRPPKNDRLHQRSGWFARLRKGLAVSSLALATSFRSGLFRRHPMHRVVDDWFGGMDFASLRLPFACVALDLTVAEERRFDAGPLAPALKAGVAIGFVFQPFAHGENLFVDAAPMTPVPVLACRALGAACVLAVDVSAPVESVSRFDTGMEVALRILAAGQKRMSAEELSRADLAIRPDAQDVFWGDFTRCREMVERGRQAMRAAMPSWMDRIGRSST